MREILKRYSFGEKSASISSEERYTGRAVQGGSMRLVWLFTGICLFSGGASAAKATPFSLNSECTTDGTNYKGERKSCDTAHSTFTVPDGYVINEKLLKWSIYNAAGSERDCHYELSNYVEVIPDSGLVQPRTLTYWSHARSPRGHDSGRGWIGCNFSGVYVPYIRG